MSNGSDGVSDPFSFGRTEVTEEIEQRVGEFIRLYGLFAKGGRILLAVSGGADSIALLHVLTALQGQGRLAVEFVCAHINHRLRAAESDADERFVVEEATRLHLPAAVRSVEVQTFARTHRLSLETAGRQLRLARLSEIAREQGCTWIATGHQKNDNAETVLHRLQRGTGFRGLAGIRPVRRLDDDLRLARPLLCVTREEIVRYLDEHDLRWREDRTNTDATYTRNFIRHRLLPLLQRESRTPIVEELSQLAIAAGKLYDRIRREAERAWDTIVQVDGNEIRIDASGLASLPELVAIELIRRALVSVGCGERDLTEYHYRGVLQSAREGAAGKGRSLPGGFAARYESGRIVLHKARQREDSVQGAPCMLGIPGRTQFDRYEINARILPRDEVDPAQFGRDKDPFTEYLDWERLRPPVIVRPRGAGDRFQPLGLDSMTKVGKFLTAARTPRDVRERVVVFADREKIIWVCPVRIAEPVKVTEGTRQVLALMVRSIGENT